MREKVKRVIYGLLGAAVGMRVGYIKNEKIKAAFIIISTIILIGILVKDRIRWVQNNKIIGDRYIKLKKNMAVDIILFLILGWGVLSLYSLEKAFIYRETGKEGLDSFIYFISNINVLSIIILLFIVVMILIIVFGIISKFICPSKISSEGILFTEGMLVTFDRIEKIEVESSMIGNTRKIKIYFDKGYRIVKSTKEKYAEIRNILVTNSCVYIEEDSICRSEI